MKPHINICITIVCAISILLLGAWTTPQLASSNRTYLDRHTASIDSPDIADFAYKDTLNEVLVVAERLRKNWCLVDACIRSTQVDDGEVSYFTEAKVTYAYNKNKRGNYGNTYLKVHEARSFVNQELIDSRKNHNVGITFRIVGVPELPFKVLPNRIFKKYNFEDKSNYVEPVSFLSEDRAELKVEQTDKGLLYVLRDIKSEKARKAIATEVEQTSKVLKMHFDSSASQHLSRVKSFSELLHFNEESHFKVQHNKDKAPISIEVNQEIFIEDVSLVSKIDKRKFQGRLNIMPSVSANSPAYSNNCDCELYEPSELEFE